MKNSKNDSSRKFNVGVRRFLAAFSRILWLGLFIGAFSFLAYIVIACVIIYLETGYRFKLFKFVESWNRVKSWYEVCKSDTQGYIPTIVVASASLLLTMTTLAQAHYSRVQDRAINFPKNQIDVVSIGMDLVSNVQYIRKYFSPVRAKMLLEFSFKEGFSTYYKAYPYRIYVSLKKINANNSDRWEELKILNYQYSNMNDSNSNDYEILLETSVSKLLIEYCALPKDSEDNCLKIILDIRWTNNLIPYWQRAYSNIYMREEIELSRKRLGRNDRTTQKMAFENNYKVLFTEHMRAPLVSLFYIKKCKETIKQQKCLLEEQQETINVLKTRRGE